MVQTALAGKGAFVNGVASRKRGMWHAVSEGPEKSK
jgi:hypothetical protein